MDICGEHVCNARVYENQAMTNEIHGKTKDVLQTPIEDMTKPENNALSCSPTLVCHKLGLGYYRDLSN